MFSKRLIFILYVFTHLYLVADTVYMDTNLYFNFNFFTARTNLIKGDVCIFFC